MESACEKEQFTRAIRKIALAVLFAASQLLLLINLALPSYIYTGSFSCEHEICLHKRTSELYCTNFKKWVAICFFLDYTVTRSDL